MRQRSWVFVDLQKGAAWRSRNHKITKNSRGCLSSNPQVFEDEDDDEHEDDFVTSDFELIGFF